VARAGRAGGCGTVTGPEWIRDNDPGDEDDAPEPWSEPWQHDDDADE